MTVSASDVIAREAHMCSRSTAVRRSCSHADAARISTTSMDASISTSSRASASRLSATPIPSSRAIVAEQATELLHTSNLFFHPLQGELAERLATLSGLPRAFFCNSGTEAVEACLKFARRFWFTAGEPRQDGHRRLHGSFHGRTMGALSVTGDDRTTAIRSGRCCRRDLRAARTTDAAVAAAITSETARSSCSSRSRAKAACARCRRRSPRRCRTPATAPARSSLPTRCSAASGAPGVAFCVPDARPAAATRGLGKALGAGVPIGAALVSEDVAAAPAPGRSRQHVRRQSARLPRGPVLSSTSCSSGGLLADVARVGRASRPPADARSAASTPIVREVRGRGLMWGLDLDRPAARSRRRGAGGRPPGQRDGKDGGATVAAAHDHRNRGG